VKQTELLRFPFNKKVNLVTTLGLFECEIVRASEEYVSCKNVKYQDMAFEGIYYLDRKAIIGFSVIMENTKSNNLKSECKILNFKEEIGKIKRNAQNV